MVDMYLDGIGCLLQGQPGIEVETVTDLQTDAARVIRMKRPKVVLAELTDLHPPETPRSTLRALHDACPDSNVVAVLANADPFVARDVLQAGACGCLTKAARVRHLVDAVWHASRGEQYIAPAVSIALADVSVQNGTGDLSLRENEVLRMIALGFTNQEIAEQIHLSVRTVETHRARLQSKLGVSRRVDLVRAAREHGLLG
jgi:two-component system response regulator NreC